MDERFRIVDGVPQRLNSEGFWVGPTDVQPNPDYVKDLGIHGWDGVTRIDIAPDVVPGDEVVIPSISTPTSEAVSEPDQEEIAGSQLGRPNLDFQIGPASRDIPVTKIGPHVIF